jgi:hypothetical protein
MPGPGAGHLNRSGSRQRLQGRVPLKGNLMPKSRRPHASSPRKHCVAVKYNEAEFAVVERAAARDGLAVAAYLGRVGTDAATGTAVPASRVQLDALKALQDAIEQARMAGRLFNQVVARLNATGRAGPEFRRYADSAARAVRSMEEAAAAAVRKIF